MTDDDFDFPADERIRALVASHYNPPAGAVPREAMWAGVRAARRAERATPVPLRTIRRLPQWGWPAALAAGLVLGIAVDRYVATRGGSTEPARAPAQRVATTAPVATSPATAPGDGAARDTSVAPRTAPRVASAASAAPAAPFRAPRGGTRVALAAPRRAGDDAAAAPSRPDPRALYETAAVQTLVQAEALLTAYRSAPPAPQDAEALRQTARWSREVLSSTRLLLDSPAGGDPRLRALLRDLELVLAQIVQLSGEPLRPQERDLIERAMHERDLLPRLRSAVPAGAATT